MNILHISDLHLGKTIFEYSLIEDQKNILKQVIDELKQFDYQVLIIAGDIYDRSIPPPEAVRLFGDFLTEIHNNFSNLHVCIIAGNHDSGTRLSFLSSLLHLQNIHIVGLPEDAFKPIIVNDGDFKVQFFLLPSLTPGSIKKEKTDIEERLYSQEGLFEEAIKKIRQTADKTLPAVLIGHLFANKGIASDSERHFIGTIEQVSSSIFSDFSYTALGHLHKPQKINETIWYSGSPLAYSFDEAGYQKNMLRVKLENQNTETKELSNDLFSEQSLPRAKVTVSTIDFKPLHKIASLQGNFSEFFQGKEFDNYKDYYLEITLNNSEIVMSPMQLLKNKFPYLLSIKQNALPTQNKVEKTNNNEMKKNDSTKDSKQRILENFELFLKDIYKDELTEDQKKEVDLFTKLSGEILDETNKN